MPSGVKIPILDFGNAFERIMDFKDFEDGYTKHIDWLIKTNQTEKAELAEKQKRERTKFIP